MIISKIIDLKSFEEIFEKYNYQKKKIGFFQKNFFIELCKNNLNQKYSIFLLSDEKNFIILPLCNFKYKGLTFFGFLGSPDLCEENDIIHNFSSYNKFSKALDDFFKLKKKKYFFCNLKKGYFSNYLNNNKKFYELNSMSSNIVNLKENYYVNEIKIQKSINYDLRKFSKDTEIKKKFIHKDINLEEFENLNILEFIRYNKAIANKEFSKILKFIIDLYKKKIVKINVLKIDNIILSSIIYAVYEKKLYYMIPVYNKKFKKFSFGKIHLDKLIKNNSDIDYLFLGPGEENYKKKFNLTNDRIFFYSNSLFLKCYYQIKSIIYGKNF